MGSTTSDCGHHPVVRGTVADRSHALSLQVLCGGAQLPTIRGGGGHKYAHIIMPTRPNRYNFPMPATVQDPHPRMFAPHDGHCYVSPCDRVAYVQISKCASTEMTRWCLEQGWHHQQYSHRPWPRHRGCVVLLRDPWSRWLSAVGQWLANHGWRWQELEPETRRVLRQHFTVDDHTQPQHRFLLGLPLAQITAVDVVPGTATSERLREVMSQWGYRCWLDPARDRDRNPVPDLEAWRRDRQFMHSFHAQYAQDYWLRLFLLDAELPAEILASRV